MILQLYEYVNGVRTVKDNNLRKAYYSHKIYDSPDIPCGVPGYIWTDFEAGLKYCKHYLYQFREHIRIEVDSDRTAARFYYDGRHFFTFCSALIEHDCSFDGETVNW